MPSTSRSNVTPPAPFVRFRACAIYVCLTAINCGARSSCAVGQQKLPQRKLTRLKKSFRVHTAEACILKAGSWRLEGKLGLAGWWFNGLQLRIMGIRVQYLARPPGRTIAKLNRADTQFRVLRLSRITQVCQRCFNMKVLAFR